MPCSPSNCSRASASVRASRAPARSSTAAIAPFSSSVSVRIRSVSISSISVPSKKSPGLSGRDLRVVVEDDRRREHRVRLPLLADQDRPGADVAARGGGLAPALGRVQQRDELAAVGRRGSRASRPASGAGPRRGCAPRRPPAACGSTTRSVTRNSPSADLGRRDLDDSLDGLLLADQDAADLAVRPAHRLRPPPAREGERPARGPGDEFAQRHFAEARPRAPPPPARCGRACRRPAATRRAGTAAPRRPATPRAAGRSRRPGGPSGAGSGRRASKVVAGVPRTRHSVWLLDASPPPAPGSRPRDSRPPNVQRWRFLTDGR